MKKSYINQFLDNIGYERKGEFIIAKDSIMVPCRLKNDPVGELIASKLMARFGYFNFEAYNPLDKLFVFTKDTAMEMRDEKDFSNEWKQFLQEIKTKEIKGETKE